jgi:hypothetical protein
VEEVLARELEEVLEEVQVLAEVLVVAGEGLAAVEEEDLVAV